MRRAIMYGMGSLMMWACSSVELIKKPDLYQSPEDLIDDDPITTRNNGFVAPEARQGYDLVWSDEFDGDELDGFKWALQEDGSGGGNNELQFYTKSKANCFVRNGLLHIKAIKRSSAFHGMDYTSARLHSRGNAKWRYGRFDIRAKVPVQQGIWPAIWMLPKENKYGTWPKSGEIDIMESVGHEAKTVHGTLHFGPAWPDNKSTGSQVDVNRGNVSQAFHLYSVEWDENEIRWYLDDKLYGRKSKADLKPERWPFDQDFYMILNLAVGGDWPGSPNDETVFPKYMFVDYVRVFKKTSI